MSRRQHANTFFHKDFEAQVDQDFGVIYDANGKKIESDSFKKHGNLYVPKNYDPSAIYINIGGSFSIPIQWSNSPNWYYVSAIGEAPEPKPQPPLPVRKSGDGFVAYRGWQLDEDDAEPTLRSMVQATAWDGPVFVADGPPSEREPDGNIKAKPGEYFGIYAFKSAKELMDDDSYPDCDVWGEVLMFGRVIVHEMGYRGERCMIRKLVIPPQAYVKHENLADRLIAKYGCDVTTDYTTLLRSE